MHDDLTRLEEELMRLRPVAPPQPLEAAIARRMRAPVAGAAADTEPVVFPRRGGWSWLAAAAVAVLAATVVTLVEQATTESRAERERAADRPVLAKPTERAVDGPGAWSFTAAERSRYILAAEPEGIVELPDGTPARRVRTHSIQTVSYIDGSGGRLEVAAPREDVILVPLPAY